MPCGPPLRLMKLLSVYALIGYIVVAVRDDHCANRAIAGQHRGQTELVRLCSRWKNLCADVRSDTFAVSWNLRANISVSILHEDDERAAVPEIGAQLGKHLAVAQIFPERSSSDFGCTIS